MTFLEYSRLHNLFHPQFLKKKDNIFYRTKNPSLQTEKSERKKELNFKKAYLLSNYNIYLN